MGTLRKIKLNAITAIISLLQLLVFTNPLLLVANTISDNFKPDETPIIRAIQVESPGSPMAGYIGCKIIITGINFIDVTAVLVNKSPVPTLDYTVVNEGTITFNAIAATGFIEVLTRANGGAIYATPYTNLGYITASSGNWNQDSTWLNKKVPPNLQDAAITIAHTVKATSGILNVGELTITKTGDLKVSATLNLYGNCINKGNLDTEGTLRMHPKSLFKGNTPVYSYSSVLQYKGYKGEVRDEWIGNGTSAGAGTPSSVILSDDAEIKIASGKRSLESGITIGDNCTLTLDSSDITVGGNWNKSDSAIFNPGSGNITFRGSNNQKIIGNNTFNSITINNSDEVAFLGPTSISGTLNFILGKIILKENDLTMQPGATLKGYNNRRYIVTTSTGKLWQKTHTAGIVYPIGNKSYNPVTFNTVATDSYGIRVVDSILPAFDKEKMINRMWAISTLSTTASLNISAQYNRADRGKHFDTSKPIMGFYGNGWNTKEAVLTETENAVTASATNLAMQSKEQYLLIGNVSDIKEAVPEPVVVTTKEPEPESHAEIPFNVTIRPNPFTTNTKIIVTSPDTEKTIKIYDATGNLMLTEILQGTGVQRITVGDDFPSGVYTAVVLTKNNKKTKTIRFIKR